MIIHNNIAALNANRNYRINTKNKSKTAEKLGSGYRINMAADDAAGVTISEKMRWQIRGLSQGSRNAQDGISWLQTGEGALGEVHDILHRMTELTIQSLNDTNTRADRDALQAEFDALQSEIDRISDTTQFNTKNIFLEHQPQYYEVEGNVHWNQGAYHAIDSSNNTLTFSYKTDENAAAKNVTITVEEGIYTTQELIDEIDNALHESGAADDGVVMEYTDEGTCNLTIEGGKKLESTSGGLSYLLNDMYGGGSVGALIGTTIFRSEYSQLKIQSGKNDNMSFEIQSFDGNISKKEITIPQGNYTRQELLDFLNQELAGTSIKAVKYSTGIKLQSDDCIITGFKGNMFRIDKKPDPIYTSVFYDNVMYGNATMSAAEFRGGAVITGDTRDAEHNHYTIDSTNNELTIDANGSGPVTLTLAEGTYTTAQMAAMLNNLFQANSIDVTASSYTSGNFSGLNLVSGVKGLNSAITFDTASAAYATLFTRRNYTNFVNNAVIYSEPNADKVPYVQGGKSFQPTDYPLEINAGVNDSFNLSLNGTNYKITLDAGNYSTMADIVNALDEKLNGSGALLGYKDKVSVSADASNRLVLTGKAGSGLTGVNVSAVSGNKGYNDLFVGTNVTYSTATASASGTSSTPAKITLNTPVTDPATINADNNKLTINQNGSNRQVTLPTGPNVSHDEIAQAINTQLAEKTVTTIHKFSDIGVKGSATNNVVTASGTGNTSTNYWSGSNQGDSTENQGMAGVYDKNIAATITLPKQLSATTVIDGNNDNFTITVNGDKKTVTLSHGSFSQEQLRKELQKKLDAVYGTYESGVTVTLDNAKLKFTCNLKYPDGTQADGKATSIAFNVADSSFAKELFTTRTAAVATTSKDLQSSITIDAGSNQFAFQYNDGTGNRTVQLNLAEGTYSRSTIVAEINKQLQAENIGIKASLSGNKLCMTTNEKGSPLSISYSNTNGGSSAEALFGDKNSYYPASATADCDTQATITIDDSSNGFSIMIDGQTHNITLDNGTYNRSSFVTMLNQKLADDGAGVNVTLSGNRLKYTTVSKGTGAEIYMTYAGGGSSMKAIYGETTTVIPGVKAEFTSDNKLQLTGTKNGGSLSVSSTGGSIFQTRTRTETPIPPSAQSGYISTNKAYIDGANITAPVVIDEWNKNLKFSYNRNGGIIPVDITLDEKSYSFDELKSELQSKLDAVVGAGELVADVSASGVRIETTHVGSKYSMNGFSGGFYYNVLCSSNEVTNTQGISKKVGGQRIDSAYTIGRRDVKNKAVLIEHGMNDQLTFDLTYGGSTKTITMKLDPGSYQGKSLVNQIQQKLSEQLVNLGLDGNLIKVGIGEVSTGVSGANDENALCFMMNQNVAMPAEGQYIIDGVRGNAAFYLFYQSDGEMVPAYTKGSKDITQGVGITDENNELSFTADGVSYDITLGNGEYSASELVNEINDKLTDAAAPVSAKMEGKNLKLYYNSYGNHVIDDVKGSARSTIFFQENSGDGKRDDLNLQLSSNAGTLPAGQQNQTVTPGRDSMAIEKRVMNTVELGINSIVITKPKYAEKALNRLGEALDKVSAVRSEFGAVQNRLEHAIAGNNNTEENTQRAESALRDADMAEEMMEYSKHNILQQASQAVLAQANNNLQGVLKLLE